jgi:hypothetical protein
MDSRDSTGDAQLPTDVGREAAFWERYREVVLAAGVEESVAVWYRRHVEHFIAFLKPRRLREARPADVSDFLLRIHREPDTEAWHARQADKALRILYQQMVKTPWAAEWSVPLPLEEVAESVPSAELGRGPVFEKWGKWALFVSYRADVCGLDGAICDDGAGSGSRDGGSGGGAGVS